MANPQPVEPAHASLDEALAEAKAAAREQLEAASQIQIARVTEQLASGWNAQIDAILEERLTDLDSRIREHQERRRREAFDRLSQAARRLRQFESEEQWSRALVEATEGLCQRSILFAVNRQKLELRAARGVNRPEPENGPAPEPLAIASAPAFAGVVDTKDTVVALRTRGELSEPIVNLVGDAPDRRATLFPLLTRDRVAAVLYADSDGTPLETSALELLTTLAGAILESAPKSGKLLTIFGAPPPPERPTTWAALNKGEQDLHLRAQRFARVQVAEMRLYKSQAVKNGRLGADLYSYLKYEIDAGREAFRRDFLSATPSMVDYFHLELVQTLANDDAALLGKEYPGPLVAGS
jgi:hypothetical protein